MPPAARLSMPYGKRLPSISIAPARFRVQGWDPLLIVSQIVSLQCLHYLTLSLILPILLSTFASPSLLAYEGGPSSVSLIMDWREFTGSPTVSLPPSARRGLEVGLVGLAGFATRQGPGGTGAGGALIRDDVVNGLVRVIERDSARGWTVAAGWLCASMVDIIYLYHLIRRPTHILDFSLTLIFNHLILTTYFSSAFPSSFFFWSVLAASTIAQIVIAEQWCVRREMREGFTIDASAANTPIPPTPSPAPRKRQDDLEMGKMKTEGMLSASSGGNSGSGAGNYERVPSVERD